MFIWRLGCLPSYPISLFTRHTSGSGGDLNSFSSTPFAHYRYSITSDKAPKHQFPPRHGSVPDIDDTDELNQCQAPDEAKIFSKPGTDLIDLW